jgi:hypothetical protein
LAFHQVVCEVSAVLVGEQLGLFVLFAEELVDRSEDDGILGWQAVGKLNGEESRAESLFALPR